MDHKSYQVKGHLALRCIYQIISMGIYSLFFNNENKDILTTDDLCLSVGSEGQTGQTN